MLLKVRRREREGGEGGRESERKLDGERKRPKE